MFTRHERLRPIYGVVSSAPAGMGWRLPTICPATMWYGRAEECLSGQERQTGPGVESTRILVPGRFADACQGPCRDLYPQCEFLQATLAVRSLSGATWAPAYIAYGDNNRTACVRIPFGRIELGLPDGAANPYLRPPLPAAAGLDGIDRRLDPGEPLNVNLYELSPEDIRARSIDFPPQSLSAALDALEADEVVMSGMGTQLAAEFIRLKRMEWAEYSRNVGGWETQRYLEMF